VVGRAAAAAAAAAGGGGRAAAAAAGGGGGGGGGGVRTGKYSQQLVEGRKVALLGGCVSLRAARPYVRVTGCAGSRARACGGGAHAVL
jgi:hypothetical protein